MAESISSAEWPRRPSLRCSSTLECALIPRRRRPAARALTLGWGRLEVLCRTCGSPHDTRRLRDGRRRPAGCLLPDPRLHLGGKRRVLTEIVADVFPALAQALVAVGHPGPALLENPVLDRRIDQRALARDPFVEEDVELGGPERWGDLV